MFKYEELKQNQQILDHYILKDKINVVCDCCNSIFSSSKKNILRRINSGKSEIYCGPNGRCNGTTDTNVICLNCNTTFYKKPSNIEKSPNHYCCIECFRAHQKETMDYGVDIEIECKACGIYFLRRKGVANRKTNQFCSKKCSSPYNESLSKKGKKRSKFEIYTENLLIYEYPYFKFHFNDKQIIGSELDIYIEDLNLAIEINGPYHYKPIKGFAALNKTIGNDIRKECNCFRSGITLHSIDISKMTGYGNEKYEKYYSKIKEIIEKTHFSK